MMYLLYLAIAYMLGVACGRWLWGVGWLDCSTPDWLWSAPLLLLPLTRLCDTPRSMRLVPANLRWSARYGFGAPRYGPTPVLLSAILLCLLSGILRYAATPLRPCWEPTDLAYYNLPVEASFDKNAPKVLIQGYVSSYPLIADKKQKMLVAATTLQIDGVEQPVTGLLRLSTNVRQRFVYGQPLLLRGRLVTPPEFDTFSWRDKLAQQGVYSVLYDARIETAKDQPLGGNPIKRALYHFRSQGEALINRNLPEPYAALANGMLLGVDSGIPDDLYDLFNATGSSHVIVISGSNVALISGFFMGLGRRLFGRKWAIWPTLLAIAAYSLLVGGDPAVLRAALMGSMVVVATTIGRQSTALVSLLVACWVMTLINPLTLWDLGFQLSSSATAGLIIFSPGVERVLLSRWRKAPGKHGSNAPPTPSQFKRVTNFISGTFSEALVATIAANIATLPLIVFYFGRLSSISLLTNLAVVPVQPAILFPGSAAVVFGVLFEPIGWLLLKIVHIVLIYTVTIVAWTGSLPFASLTISTFTWPWLGLSYTLIVLLRWRSSFLSTWRWWTQHTLPGWRLRLIGVLATGLFCVASVVFWGFGNQLPDGRLHVYFLDIGQGDGILIETPSGRQVLIDGGKEPDRLVKQLESILPRWDRQIDLAVLTHPDSDHMWGQMALPGRYRFDHALETNASRARLDSHTWRSNMQSINGDIQLQHTGGSIDLGDGVILYVLWPPADGFQPAQTTEVNDRVDNSYDNENGMVIKVVYGQFSTLLTADIGVISELEMIEQHIDLSATVLKAGHHGSHYSNSAAFIAAVNPQVVVIQVGAENEYGHPHRATLNRLAGRTILRNDTQGRVEISSDGQHLWMESERNQP